MTASLTLRGLGKRYPGDIVGLADATLDVAAGELFVVLGQASAGKTTLLRLIAGLETPTAGTIRIGGDDMAGRPAGRRPVSLVFQGQALFPHMSAAGNVGYGLGRRRRNEPEVQELVRGALVLVGLGRHAARYPADLDDSERRLLAFARALARRPRVLLLDNPLAGLVGAGLAELLARFVAIQRATGLTVLLATDDPDAALGAADRAAVLDGGRFSQVGTPEDLRRRPRSRLIARYVGRLNLLEGTIAGDGAVALPGIGTVATALPGRRGEPATIGIAPEHVALVPAQPPPPTFALRARRPIFQGGARRLLLETLDGEPFIASCPDPAPREGDILWATWRAEDVVAIGPR